jgi:hypothetical protein
MVPRKKGAMPICGSDMFCASGERSIGPANRALEARFRSVAGRHADHRLSRSVSAVMVCVGGAEAVLAQIEQP